METRYTPGPWEIRWYECTADSNDVAYAKKEGEQLKVGDVLWRVPYCIGPVAIDHNHWAGDHLDVGEEDAHLVATAPLLYEALERLAKEANGPVITENTYDYALYVLAKARGEFS